MRRSLLAVVLVSTTLMLPSCSKHSEGALLEEDPQLAAQIAELRETGGTRPLAELVPGSWDTVYIARDPVHREDIERAAGRPVDMPDYITYGNVLVFMDQDRVFRAVQIKPVQIHPGTGLVMTYTSAVRLVAPRPGTIQARPVEPGQPAPGMPEVSGRPGPPPPG
jgi:hypothetical protein